MQEPKTELMKTKSRVIHFAHNMISKLVGFHVNEKQVNQCTKEVVPQHNPLNYVEHY